MDETSEKDGWTVAEFASRWSLTEDTVRELIRTKQLPGLKLGGSVRVPRQPFERWQWARTTGLGPGQGGIEPEDSEGAA